MLFKIIDNGRTYAYKDIDESFCVTHAYGGMKSLQFDVKINHPLYPYLREEVQLQYNGQYYLIKGVNERTSAGICTINAELDLTGLENKVYIDKKWNTVSFKEFTDDILSGTGWIIYDAELISKRTSPEAQDNTPLELLEQSTNKTSFGACYEYDTRYRRITCIKPENNTTPSGCYFTDELNLSEITVKGTSSGLVTRLYPIGKDGLTIKSVNNGLDYIENHSYSDKVICRVWRDERYTNAQSLKEDGIVKLAALANPERSYTCKVIDLAKTNPETYGTILSYKLYDVITLVDRIRKSRINHRIVELKEYPANHALDTVTLSTVAGRISGQISRVNDRIKELDAQQLHDRTKINEIKQDLDTTVLHVSDSWAESENKSMITQTAEGLFFDVSKAIGADKWSTKLRQSSTDIQIAFNNISNVIKFENAQMNIYNNEKKKIISFNSSGEDIYYNGSRVGRIGATYWGSDTSKRGLAFNLDNSAAFISWARNPFASGDSYAPILLYSVSAFDQFEANILNILCNLDAHNKSIKNPVLDNWSFSGGSISGTFEGRYIVDSDPEGHVTLSRTFKLVFKDGILQSGYW